MGSFSQEPEEDLLSDAEFGAIYAEMTIPLPRRPVNSPQAASFGGCVDLPMAPARSR